MPSSPIEPVDLLDLKLLPAWVKEPSPAKDYAHYQGDEDHERPIRRDREGKPQDRRRPERDRRPPRAKPASPRDRQGDRRPPRSGDRPARSAHRLPDGAAQQHADRQKAFDAVAGQIAVRFIPHPPALENVIGQIKSNAVAYSVFALARLFLEKPERYDVHLAVKPEVSLYQLGEDGVLSLDRSFLENNAFRFAQSDFYKIEVTQSEPIKGNFTTVARCRASGTLLGPTNHHAYQPRLRSLYEQRFSRRMTFPEYQRQIEIVTDPAAVEQWKEDARNVTTYSALGSENPSSFGSAAEAERHFRQNHLPDLVHDVKEITIDGVASRQLPDRTLRRLIEDAWSKETRSPSQMMQELAKTFRESSLQIFRHRRGMLFVSPIRVRPLAQEQIALSAQVKAILEMLTANPRTNRKDLADKLLADVVAEEIEARKLALASDLRWLISEGYVIEFNDGSLDLPRTRTPKPAEETASQKTEQSDRPMAEGEGAKEAEPGKREEVLGPSDSVDGPNTDEPSQAQDDFTGQEIGSS